MINEEFLKVINKHERIKNLYDIGPVQKAQIGDFIDDIVRVLDNGYYDDFHQFLLDNDYIHKSE